MECELSTRGGGVQVLLEAAETHAFLVEFVDGVNQVFEVAAEPIKPPNDQGVASAQNVFGAGPAGTVSFGSADMVFEDSFAARLLQCVALELEVLIVGADPGIADYHGVSLKKNRMGLRYTDL